MKKFLWVAFLAVALASCSGKPVDETNPNSVYEDALHDVENERFILALEKLRTVRNKFPYSAVATEAHLKIADIYFMQESYVEAAAAYEAFRDLHPKHPKSSYASFRIGESYYKDIPTTISRDLTSAVKAQEALQLFLDQYKTGEEVEQTKKFLLETRTALANKELYIANFYLRQDDTAAATKRYQKIIELYPETPTASQAKEKLDKMGAQK